MFFFQQQQQKTHSPATTLPNKQQLKKKRLFSMVRTHCSHICLFICFVFLWGWRFLFDSHILKVFAFLNCPSPPNKKENQQTNLKVKKNNADFFSKLFLFFFFLLCFSHRLFLTWPVKKTPLSSSDQSFSALRSRQVFALRRRKKD